MKKNLNHIKVKSESKSEPLPNSNTRLLSFVFILIVLLMIIAPLVGYFRIFKEERLDESVIKKKTNATFYSIPQRGSIYDRNGNILATTVIVYSLAANPSKLKDPKKTISVLQSLFEEVKKQLTPEEIKEFEELDIEKISQRFDNKKLKFVRIARQIPNKLAEKITELKSRYKIDKKVIKNLHGKIINEKLPLLETIPKVWCNFEDKNLEKLVSENLNKDISFYKKIENLFKKSISLQKIGLIGKEIENKKLPCNELEKRLEELNLNDDEIEFILDHTPKTNKFKKEELTTILKGLSFNKEEIEIILNESIITDISKLKDKIDEETDPLYAISLTKDIKRVYPNGSLLSHVLGFINIGSLNDKVQVEGLAGIELKYNEELKEDKIKEVSTITDKRRIPILVEGLQPELYSSDGYNLYLTIDENIQHIIEEEIEKAYLETKAKKTMALVMNPHTGEVLGLAIKPDFDPNFFQDYDSPDKKELLNNIAITSPYEPGSTFKIIASSAALEEKVATIESKFFCENGKYPFGSSVIHDVHPYGTLSFGDVIKKSSNIGTTKMAELLGMELFSRYISDYGFGLPTGIDLPGESPGILRPLNQWTRIDLATHAFGQGISVTPIQIANAYSVIANGGSLLKPFIVKKITDKYGNTIVENTTTIIRRVISEETSKLMIPILQSVTEQGGTGTQAAIPGYKVAGKTGTSQKVVSLSEKSKNLDKEKNNHLKKEENKKTFKSYSNSALICSFVGFLPADDPKFTIIVVIDEPGGNPSLRYGGILAAPVFKAIGLRLLNYYNIPPSVTSEDKEKKEIKVTKTDEKNSKKRKSKKVN